MGFRISLLLGAALVAACGGTVKNTADAGGGGSGAAEASSCPPGSMVPDAAVYGCEAEPPGSVGCAASGVDPQATSEPRVYSEGCVVTLPMRGGFCAGPCCGGLQCFCQHVPSAFNDGGLQFVCPD
jgi:hypothetical protein